MMLRALILAGGVLGAAGASQFPEFSQQYVQRLGGAVDELSRFVGEFDADARALGLTRDAALQDLARGSEMGQSRAATMTKTLARHDLLSTNLATLRQAGPFTRAYNAALLTDGEIARAAWSDYRPAIPLTFEGAVFAGVGLLAGLGVLSGLLAFFRMIFRRKESPAPNKA